MKYSVLLSIFLCMVSFGAAPEESDWPLIGGTYELIGRRCDSDQLINGTIVIDAGERDGTYIVTRIIAGKKIVGSGQVESVTMDKIPVLKIHFQEDGKEMEGTYLFHADLDNEGRFTGYVYPKGPGGLKVKKPGLEAFFADTRWANKPAPGCSEPRSSRMTPLQRFHLLKGACKGGDERSVEILLEMGADPNGAKDYMTGLFKSKYGDEFSSPMTAAAMHGKIEIMKLLIAHGAAVDVVEAEGQTPLVMAIFAKRKESVAFLLTAGADSENRHIARTLAECDDPEIVALVGQAIAKKRNQVTRSN